MGLRDVARINIISISVPLYVCRFSTWVVVRRAVLQNALEDRALAHVDVPVHHDRDFRRMPRPSQSTTRRYAERERVICRVLAGDRADRARLVTAVAFLFAIHSVVDEGMGEKINKHCQFSNRAINHNAR